MNQQQIYEGWHLSQKEWEHAKNELDIAEKELFKPFQQGIAVAGVNPPLKLIERVEYLRVELDNALIKKDEWIKRLKDI